jgi:hypothetical protein
MSRYFCEFNRVEGDSIQLAARRLRQRGVGTDRLPHKTALVLERPDNMSWGEFSEAVTSVLHPRRGSVMRIPTPWAAFSKSREKRSCAAKSAL